MLAKLATYSLFGIEAVPIEVEVDISPAALPKTILVGLAEAAVKESIHRIERALVNSGYSRPFDRIVINLSPADLPKDAASFDLPIALGLLTASGQLQSERFDKFSAVGELALDGTVRPIKGTLSMAVAARQDGKVGIVVPVANAREAAVVEDIQVIAVGSLAEAVGFYSGQLDIEPESFSWAEAVDQHGRYPLDYADVKRQATTLEIRGGPRPFTDGVEGGLTGAAFAASGRTHHAQPVEAQRHRPAATAGTGRGDARGAGGRANQHLRPWQTAGWIDAG